VTEPPRRDIAWRFTFCDLRTRRPLARLPLVDADLGEVIGGPADGSGKVPLSAPEVRRADPWAATQQRRTICFAERVQRVAGREQPTSALWAGIVWKRERDGRSLALSMSTPESYLARRRIAVLRTFPDTTDDADILRTLIGDAQAVPGGNIGITLPVLPAGSSSARTSDPAADRTLLEEVQSAADAAPLEWRIAPGGNARDGFTLTLLTAPRLGGNTTSSLVWTSNPGGRAGSEVIGYKVTEDGSGVPNTVHAVVTPPGTGAAQLRSTATATAELDGGYVLLEQTAATETDGVTTQAGLDRLAAAELAQLARNELQVTSLTVRGDRGPDLTSYTLGDTLTLRARDVLWPTPRDLPGRVLARRIAPAQPGRNETVTMTLGGV
jgi:hypothetical protein